jgi:hypothetical protein
MLRNKSAQALIVDGSPHKASDNIFNFSGHKKVLRNKVDDIKDWRQQNNSIRRENRP